MKTSQSSPAEVKLGLRQAEIYRAGVSGERPAIPVSPAGLEYKALKKLSARAGSYISSGAGREDTMASNLSDFGKWHILPRVLKGIADPDCSIDLLGDNISSPILLAPVGGLGLAHPEGDVAAARAAADRGIPMIFSNQASRSMEDCAAVMADSPRWFQLYWTRSDELTISMLRRANNCGCRAIVLTVDTPMLGWRVRDLEEAFLPFTHGIGIAQYTSDPVFQKLMDLPPDPTDDPPYRPRMTLSSLQALVNMCKNHPGSFWGNLRSGAPIRAARTVVRIFTNPELDWDRLAFLREHTDLPIYLKGILHPDDARKVVTAGFDGIIVSNHGGRQIDGSVSSIEVLPSILQAVKGEVPVLIDSGFRSGADVFKALALGAKAVCIGRPYVYGLALGGWRGAAEVIANLQDDFRIAMGLAGCRSVSDIEKDCLLPT